MKKSFKITAVLLALCALLVCLASCGGQDKPSGNDEKKPEIICTAFAPYDWVRTVLGERSENYTVRMLSGKGADMHSYQPTAEDMKSIGDAAMFIYIGGESEKWVADVQKNVGTEKTVFVNLTEALGSAVLEEETALEGSADEHEHEHDGADDNEYDEHIWLSVKNAEKLTVYIAAELAKFDPDGKSVYDANAKEYLLKLAALDAEYKKAVRNASRSTVIFADRFPFLYLMKDYGINYCAAFAGCSAESEASFKTISALSRAADEAKTDTIIITETSDGAVADAVISGMTNKGCKKAVMNSMQSVKTAEAASETYIGIMTNNLASLKQALVAEG